MTPDKLKENRGLRRDVLLMQKENTEQRAEIERLKNLAATLKLQAQIHAQEARTANGTIAEIYQCVSGATGEAGNWHGAQPVRDVIERLQARLRATAQQIFG